CWASATGNVLAWRSVDAAGAQVSTGTLSAAASAGAFRATGAVTVSGAAVGVQVRVPAAAGRRVGAVRLIAGTTLPEAWHPGQDVPQVVVDDPTETLQLVTADRVAADYSITLREVGRAPTTRSPAVRSPRSSARESASAKSSPGRCPARSLVAGCLSRLARRRARRSARGR